MQCYCRNYYKTSRETAGLTQEQAVELLDISVRSLSDYENGKTIPSNEIVEKMVDIYDTKILGWIHLKNTSELARKCLPDIQPPQTNADIYLQLDLSEDEINEMKILLKWILSSESEDITNNDELKHYEKIRLLAKKTAGKLMSIYAYEPQIKIKE